MERGRQGSSIWDVQYDGIARTLSFDPIADGRYPFTSGTAWGVATIAGDDVTLDVRGGRLDLASLSLRVRPLPPKLSAAWFREAARHNAVV